MEKYANIKEYELRYSDLDFKDELKLSALLALAQESAGASADELGFGYGDLQPQGLGFIIVNTYCEFRRPIRLGESLTVETWPLPPRHVIFERDTQFTVENEVVATLASRWCLVDLSDFSLLTADKLGETHAKCPYRADKAVNVVNWKIPKLVEKSEPVFRMVVRNSHYDHYFHANNARYADFFLDCFTVEELKKMQIRSFQITYLKQTKEGDELIFYRKDETGYSTLEARVRGEMVAQFRICYQGENE